MTSSAVRILEGTCVCGEPIFRHRTVKGRQLSCWQLRVLDQALKANAQPSGEPVGEFEVITGGRDRARQGEVG